MNALYCECESVGKRGLSEWMWVFILGIMISDTRVISLYFY
jgi:hypothetical protein